MPEVTILIAAYNAEATIRQALNSALAQRGVEFEVLVVDDGSTDATAQIVAECGEAFDGLRMVQLERNQGLAAARNAGFTEARGEFVTILDADDRLHPERTFAEVSGLRRFPDAKVAFSLFWTFQHAHERGIVDNDAINAGEAAAPALQRLDDPLTARLRGGMAPGTSACTLPTDYVRSHALYDPTQRSLVDGEQYIRCFYNQPAVYCNLPLYYRRFLPQSMSRNQIERVAMVCRAIDKARTHWQDYSAEQRRLLAGYECRCIIGGVKSMLLAGRAAEARRILDAYADRLPKGKGRFWRWVSWLPGACAAARLKSRLTPRRHQWASREEVDAIDVVADLGLTCDTPRDGPPANPGPEAVSARRDGSGLAPRVKKLQNNAD